MDEQQRFQEYLNLIDSLLNCPNGEELEILNVNQDLVDEGLIEAMNSVASTLEKEDNQDAANWLRSISDQLSAVVSASPTPEEYFDFLMQVFRLTVQSDGNSNEIYPLLQENLDKLDRFFAQMWRREAANMLSEAPSELQPGIAKAIFDFSNRVSDFPLGDRGINIEITISGYEVANIFLTRENDPENWAGLQNNLGTAYGDRIYGNRADNIDKAISCYELALQFHTNETYPEQWAKLQNNLGTAYNQRINGNRADNIEMSILAYKKALSFYNINEFPEQYATVKNNLGNTYLDKIYGDLDKNKELAIAALKSALEVRTYQKNPEEWAETQANLGNAYWERIYGEREDNIDSAIEAYKSALLVYSSERFPYRWAATQNNLANAYSDRFRGDREENLNLAIAACKLALQIRTREALPQQWAMTQNNLGKAYRTRMSGNREENLKRTLDAYKLTLEVFTYEAFPYNWALTQNNLGMVYRDLGNMNDAIICFKDALKIHTPITFPRDCLNSAWNLGNTFFISEKWIETIEAYDIAIAALEESRDWGSTDLRKAEIVSEAIDVYGNVVQACIKSLQFEKAIEYVERSKTRNLVELILTRDRHTIFPPEVVAQLDPLRDEIAIGQYELQNATAEDPTALAQHLQQLRQQRNELQDRYLPIGSGFQFEPFRSTLSDRTAIVEFYITTDKLLVFIITKQTQQPIVLSSDLIDLNKLANWANSYLKAYSNKKSHWQRRLTTRLHLLAQILHIDEIIQQIPIECNKLILIPHRYLHLLPLHALPLVGDSSLFDRFPGGVSYAPSCQLLQLAQNRQRPEFTRLFAVQNPTGDLSYTDLEVETIQSYFNTSNLLKQKIATKEAIDNTSLTVVHCAHFSCHGYFNGSEPRKSALILANAELNSAPTQPDTENYLSLENGGVLDLNKCLTLDSVFTLNLEQCRLVTLSACETGLIDFRNNSDEYIGLPSGFLYAGASSVVSSLWTVNDLSTAFLMIRFYQNLQKGLAVGLALNQAQLWLKNLTKGDLEKWIEEKQLPLKPAARMSFRRRLNKLEDDAQPFESPFYWAAFCAIGQ
ncbi:CHAT domain-containing protein [Sphaerospermopsis aphanizomenoides BCCUSP55]|uniref:CHAT domain-containing protein n=1 Tax=Sphaerospermopsis aphanizomenoides TaxID=459663 RepID=UPI0019068707|nr:CHAT domain-containing tetratricopeptide repeat protein [Sphaerospermopsis aphanizomenoides]MBK1989689.1 CHAT domain-containing protein [Sphaerospermopsis aphanizomenoides BCCUSP55]